MRYFFFFAILPFLLINCEPPTPSNDGETTPKSDTLETKVKIEETPATPSVAPPEKPAMKKAEFRLPYSLNEPKKTFKLSGKLAEISGLSLTSDGQFLLAHNDEQGKVFYLNKSDGEIEKDFKFHKSGDYEGIEMVGDKIYVLKNNGTLYEIENPGTDDQKEENYKTKLTASNDVEGLGYDAKRNQLLLACKAKAGEGKKFKKKRAIYGFDLDSKKLIDEPVYVIDREEIKDFLQTNSDRYERFLEAFAPEQAASAFSPSGISIHPKTGHIYILSSIGKLLIVLDSDGSIIHIEQLDKSIHKQPEGIAFEKDGTLWISTEGKGGRAKVFQF